MIPQSRFSSLVEGLEIMRKKGTYRYPVPNLNLMKAPKLLPKYYTLDPEREDQGVGFRDQGSGARKKSKE